MDCVDLCLCGGTNTVAVWAVSDTSMSSLDAFCGFRGLTAVCCLGPGFDPMGCPPTGPADGM